MQIISGIGLALVYVPAADKAYESLLYLNYEQPIGWFLRALHYYAGSGMVVMVLAHMTQVFLHGAYKYPRELTWIIGVCLFLFTLGMFFSGQILRWDPDAYWGLAVAGSMAGRVPGMGPWLVNLLLGEQTDRRQRLEPLLRRTRFCHSRALLIAFIAVHLWLVVKKGVSARPSRQDRRSQDLRRRVSKGTEERRPFHGRCHAKGHFLFRAGGDRGRGHCRLDRTQGPDRAAQSNTGGRKPAARMAVSLAVRPVVAESRRRGDIYYLGVSVAPDPCPVPRPVRLQSWRARSKPPPDGRSRRDRDLYDAWAS